MPIPRRSNAARVAGALRLVGGLTGRFVNSWRPRSGIPHDIIDRHVGLTEKERAGAGEKMPKLDEKFVGDLFVGSKITPEAMNFFRQCLLSDAETRNLFNFLKYGLYDNAERQQFIRLMVELRGELPDIMFLLGKWQKYGAKLEPEIGNNYRALFTALLRTTPNYAKQHLREWAAKLDQILEQEEMMRKMMGKQ